jgi:transposase InsO family protein
VSDSDIEDLAYHGGSIAALQRARPAGGPSTDTLRRAFARALTPGQRAGLKGGEPARRLYDTYLTRVPAHRNEAWEADHVQLAIEILFPDGRVGAPWLTLFVERFSHGIAGWAIADHPTQESVLAALRAGILTEPPYGPIGGVPTAIRWERGKEFLASAITDAATSLAIDAHPLPPYSPERKGGVERANRSIEQLHLAGLPGYLHRARVKSGRRVDEGDPLLTLDAFVAGFASFVREFNEERPHDGIDGEAPVTRWRSDATPLVEVSADRLHHLLLARAPRRIGRSGIRLFGASYNAAELVGRVGQSTVMTIERRWANEADVAGSTLTIDGRRRDLEENGWSRALESWPPLLSHNELGRILEGRPSELYDALAKILGLGEIAAAETLLRDTRVEVEGQIKQQERQAAVLLEQLDGLDDERARSVAEALRQKPWDLPAVERALSTNPIAVEERSALTRLRELSTLPVVPRERVDEVVGQLREVGHDLERLRGTDAALARETAALLRQALQVHGPGHEGTDCPVCGTPGVITYQWKLQASARIQDLEEQATSVEAVHQRAQKLLREARQLVSAPPAVLKEAAELGVDADEADRAHFCWAVWWTVPEGDAVVELAAHLEGAAPPLIAAVAAVRGAAAAELERREDRWRPAGRALAAWLPGAQQAGVQRARLPRLRAAEAWLKGAHEQLREQRFAPIADQVQAHWQDLRQSSSVELGQLHLEGTGSSTHRRLTLDVSIDGEPGSALGVMSQGELNCLALSLFLPRARMAESPFRFIVIDDPVQAMDPVKVEGLARVLGNVAKDRQVVVLTHDDRLPEAVRRLEMEATIIEVTRREQSVVELRTALDPVRRYIEDARAVALSKNLPPETHRIVPGFCRYALEAAAREAVTRRLAHEGKPYEEIEAAWDQATTLLMRLALAFFGDETRAGEVMTYLNRQQGPWAGDAVAICNKGAHEAVDREQQMTTIRNVEQLTARMREGAGGHR